MQCAYCQTEVPDSVSECPGCERDVGWRIRRWDGVTFGPYDERSVRLFLREGRMALSDYCQQGPEGAWVPIQQLFGAVPPPTPQQTAEVEATRDATRSQRWWIIGCVAVIVLGLGACVAVFVSAYQRTTAGPAVNVQSQCEGNLKAIGTALRLYRDDHDEHFPPQDPWIDALRPHMAGSGAFECPAPPAQPYRFNDQLNGLNIQGVADQMSCVAAYDAPLASGAAARHGSMNGVLYVDGHASMIGSGAGLPYTFDPAAVP